MSKYSIKQVLEEIRRGNFEHVNDTEKFKTMSCNMMIVVLDHIKNIEEENRDLKDALKSELNDKPLYSIKDGIIKKEGKCICQGFYQPLHCPVHGVK